MSEIESRKRNQKELGGVSDRFQEFDEKRMKSDIDESATSDSASSEGDVLDRTQKIAQAFRTIIEVFCCVSHAVLPC